MDIWQGQRVRLRGVEPGDADTFFAWRDSDMDRFADDELNYQKVSATVYSNNEASQRLHERLGFTLEGRIRRVVFTLGQHFDELHYGMTVEEYRANKRISE